MIWEDLGAITAYAIAKEKGYEGTEEEFAQMLINAAKIPDVEKTAKEAKEATVQAEKQTAETKLLTDTLKKQVNHLSFLVNDEDGGLDIIYTE